MQTSRARIATDAPDRYLSALCEHFADSSRRHSGQPFDVRYGEGQGRIDFAPAVSGSCDLYAQPGALVVEVAASDEGSLGRVQRIVARHLERFGSDEGLAVRWGPAAEVPAAN